MTRIADVIKIMETWAPLAYQESYDNAGLLVGDAADAVKGILISLDTTEEVIDEAIAKGCNLVIAHHPIIFKGLKKINRTNYIGRTIVKAIQNNIAIYATHTNLDNVHNGVNFHIASRLGLQNIQILSPKKQTLQKLVVFVPVEDTKVLLDALSSAGAGIIGNYSGCSFRVTGTGSFTPNEIANPYIGQANQPEEVTENRIEVMFPTHLVGKVLAAMRQAHPYEEIAYYVTNLENENQEVGSGAIGTLAEPVTETAFLHFLKAKMQTGCIRYTALRDKPIQKVAVCGGAGIFLLNDALRAGADIFITSDVKYHEFFDADKRIVLADIGHYESEVFTKDLIFAHLSKKISNIAVNLSETTTNPVFYL
ncbi:Nif3-like dinuclear metal center hexameric protein [Xanthocytophaga agilis]|uniref:GTP cyclohydrolase 1 type 2 homolog n=1 Tax=Xanthocytophaga agilis TaxID=3048010 RepID=A0AAE3R1U6_9BACT|nr:Nif3-like dinuclear metal center hexameric protein [Xanthocytophaga agilis]MDJ1499900.1 Nif3-like dinuclear metal center hexameric protein [Xanthocytophaga agilis]